MPSIITAGDASNGLVVASGNDGAVVIQSGLAGAKVDALSIAADGTPTYVAPTGAVAKAVAPIQLGTAIATTSGTSIDFTGIPAGVKRITLGVAGLSTTGSAELLIQIGSSAGVKTSGYLGFATYTGSATAGLNMGAGFTVRSDDAGEVQHGIINLTAIDTAAGNWAMSAILGRSNESYMAISGGAASLSAMLTSVRLTTTNGTDAFDAGSASISWEF